MQSHGNTDTNNHYISHPFLKPDLIQVRDYQVNIARNTARHNSLVVLPTALGKTIIALYTIIKVLEIAPKSKIIVVAPTRPLVMQHYANFQNYFTDKIKCAAFTSQSGPVARAMTLNDVQIIFSTPQIIQNDIQNEMYSLAGVGLIIFDEAHKAQRNYAYTHLAREYIAQCGHPLILGLTASPGKDLEKINTLCQTLFIEQVIFRDDESPDVKAYTFPIDTIIHTVELPIPIVQAHAILETAARKISNFMIDQGVFRKKNYYSKVDYLRLLADLKSINNSGEPGDYGEIVGNGISICIHPINTTHEGYGVPEPELNYPHLRDLITSPNSSINESLLLFQSINAIYLEHLTEILTTQDIRLFWNYLDRLKAQAKNGNTRIDRLLNSRYFAGIQAILPTSTISPKMETILKIINQELEDEPAAKIIIFTQYREMGKYILEELKSRHITACRFVGQANRPDDEGLTQKEQQELIRAFGKGEIKVMVATSVAEEGLDIPNVNAVVFYEAVPSEIRLIQRRGRTGRHAPGRCHFIVTPNTLDQVYHNVSHRKEERMKQILQTPGLVETVSQLDRTLQRPQHLALAKETIEENHRLAKDHREQRAIDAAKQAIAENNHPYSINGNYVVNDMTAQLTEGAEKQRERINAVKKSPAKKSIRACGMVNKTYRWVAATMECIGHWSMNGCVLECSYDALLKAAKEEGVNASKVSAEIEKGIRIGIFSRIKSDLRLASDG